MDPERPRLEVVPGVRAGNELFTRGSSGLAETGAVGEVAAARLPPRESVRGRRVKRAKRLESAFPPPRIPARGCHECDAFGASKMQHSPGRPAPRAAQPQPAIPTLCSPHIAQRHPSDRRGPLLLQPTKRMPAASANTMQCHDLLETHSSAAPVGGCRLLHRSPISEPRPARDELVPRLIEDESCVLHGISVKSTRFEHIFNRCEVRVHRHEGGRKELR